MYAHVKETWLCELILTHGIQRVTGVVNWEGPEQFFSSLKLPDWLCFRPVPLACCSGGTLTAFPGGKASPSEKEYCFKLLLRCIVAYSQCNNKKNLRVPRCECLYMINKIGLLKTSQQKTKFNFSFCVGNERYETVTVFATLYISLSQHFNICVL